MKLSTIVLVIITVVISIALFIMKFSSKVMNDADELDNQD